jgi:hypothetical protein
MIRSVLMFLLLVFGGFFLGLYVAYDEFDPCRALAVEKARRAALPTDIAEIWTTVTTEHQDRLSCSRALVASWRERITD